MGVQFVIEGHHLVELTAYYKQQQLLRSSAGGIPGPRGPLCGF